MIKAIKAEDVNRFSLKFDSRISAVMTKAMVDMKLKEITKKIIPCLKSIVIPKVRRGIKLKIKAVSRSLK